MSSDSVLASFPDEDFQAFDALEFANVGGHEGRAAAAGLGGNQEKRRLHGSLGSKLRDRAIVFFWAGRWRQKVGGVGKLLRKVAGNLGERPEFLCRHGFEQDIVSLLFNANLRAVEAGGGRPSCPRAGRFWR